MAIELTAQKREHLNKGTNRTGREEGLVPAELYGHNVPNLHLFLNGKEFSKAFKEAGETTVIQIAVGNEKYPVLVHEIQRHPLTQDVQHIDLYQVKMDEKITSHVPIVFIGESPAVKEKAGTLNKSMDELEVEALPADLPHSIEISLDSLTEVGSSIYVKDVVLKGKAEIVTDPESVIVSVVAIAEEEVETGPASIEDVEVESGSKKDEEVKEGEDEKK